MRAGLRFLAACAALLLGACQAPPEPPAATIPVVGDPAAESRAALEGGDCARAVGHLRTALASEPESLFLHYNLAACAAQAGATDEAVREFRWVVSHGDPDSPETRTARRWLIEAGLLAEEPVVATGPDPTVGEGALRGVVTWSEPGRAPAPLARQQLFLKGVRGSSNRALQYVRRSDDSGQYEFKNIPPGTYKLTDVIAGRPRWRLRVSVDAGKEVALDLGPANAATVRDDFRDD